MTNNGTGRPNTEQGIETSFLSGVDLPCLVGADQRQRHSAEMFFRYRRCEMSQVKRDMIKAITVFMLFIAPAVFGIAVENGPVVQLAIGFCLVMLFLA